MRSSSRFERSAEVLQTWNAILPTLPDELMSWASVIHFPPLPDVPPSVRGRSVAVVMAAFLGDEAEGRALLAPLRDLGPERDTFAMVPPVVLGDLAMDPYDPLPFHLTHQFLDELPAETIDELMAKVGPDSGLGDGDDPPVPSHGRRARARDPRRRRPRHAPGRDLR